MTARADIEDMLDEAAWRDRVGLERPTAQEPGAYLPPADMLRINEERYRDCPPDDAFDTIPLIPLGWWLVASVGLFLSAAIALWNAWPHR
jgi:hypothetical protein